MQSTSVSTSGIGQLGLSSLTLQQQLSVVWAVFIARVKTISRYRGFFIMDLIIPTLFAAMPILLGNAIAGSAQQAAANFEEHALTGSYVAFMVIGANVFMIVSGSLWNFGMWIRREQNTGTLEALLLTPASNLTILAGTSLYISIRMTINFLIAFFLGCLIFGVPLEEILAGNIFLAVVFLLIGMIPVFGISFLFGALIIKIKEAGPLVSLMQWVVALGMGMFFPITVLPGFLQTVAMMFPPAWMNNGVRAALLDIAYFLGTWYLDISVLFVFCFIAPMAGMWIFSRAEKSAKYSQGLGQF